MKQKTIYISGPITGLPGAFSAAQFARAERDLRDLGYRKIINPRFMFEGTGLSYDVIMRHCLDLVCSADIVLLLPGWRSSRGAQMELGAAYARRIPIYEYDASWHCDRLPEI